VSNANAYLYGFPEAARTRGVVAVGDARARTPTGSARSPTIRQLDARIEASLVAAGADPGAPQGLTLIGYSLGATLAEELVARRPERYVRVVLIGAPKDARPELVKTAKAGATMSCALDVPPRMKAGARRMEEAGVPSVPEMLGARTAHRGRRPCSATCSRGRGGRRTPLGCTSRMTARPPLGPADGDGETLRMPSEKATLVDRLREFLRRRPRCRRRGLASPDRADGDARRGRNGRGAP
jgi:pimeloyl-ACP methyl ester carboxylesterase